MHTPEADVRVVVRPPSAHLGKAASAPQPGAGLDSWAMAARDALLTVGLRVTGPRTRVLGVFLQSGGTALSAYQVVRCLFERSQEASLSSVYSALKQLEEVGLIASRFESGRRVFELAGKPSQAWVVCRQCGSEQVFQDERLDEALRQVVMSLGYVPGDYKVLVNGAREAGCPSCRETGPPRV